jgi:hypothetical protein
VMRERKAAESFYCPHDHAPSDEAARHNPDYCRVINRVT